MRIFLIIFVFINTSVVLAQPLRVMSYNILYGGTYGKSLNDTAQVILNSGADLVGIQEQYGNAEALARLLNFYMHPIIHGPAKGGAILSRYPIKTGFVHGAEIELPNGKKVYLFSVHLMPSPYQPYDLRDGKLANESEAVAAAAKTRSHELVAAMNELQPLLQQQEAVFLVGDFNEPSHLDWTDRAYGAGLHQLKVSWPTSNMVAAVGFRDAFRTFYPDEVIKPGYSWTPIPDKNEIHDRIDFVYYFGPSVQLVSTEIIGESGGPDVDIVGFKPYPSDHRAVVGSFEVAP